MGFDDMKEQAATLSPAQAAEVARLVVPRLTDDGLLEFRLWLGDEPKRREKAAVAASAKAEIVKELRNTGTLHTPKVKADEPTGFDEWVDPAGDPANAYVAGDKVFLTSTGRVYESVLQALNFDSPNSGSGWDDVTDLLFPPPSDETKEGKSKDTWDTDLDYRKGDHVVYAGEEYEVLKKHHADPGKTPDETPTLYKKIAL